MDPVNSTTFIKRPPPPTSGEAALFLARDVLLNRLFLGYYDGRRHVAQLREYRDVITVSPAEVELLADLDKIRQNLIKDCDAKWVGITGPKCEGAPAGHCLWVKLTNIPFGHYWFQIKQIKCENDEIILRLKCIRPAHAKDFEDATKDKAKVEGETQASNNQPSDYSFDFDPGKKLASLYALMNDIVHQVRPHVTWINFILACKFMIAMGIVLISAMLTCIQYLGDYFIRVIREIRLLLQAFTPIMIQAMNCFTKIIGGFFILITLMFRSEGSRQLRNQFMPMQYSSAPNAQYPPSPAKFAAVVPLNWRERNRDLKQHLQT